MATGERGFRAGLVVASFIASVVFFAGQRTAAEDALFASERITPQGEYTPGIEGPAVDASGNLYVVNFQQSGNIGKVAAGASKSELFASLPAGSIGNGIRFDRQGRMYVADFKKHNVWVIERGETTPQVYFIPIDSISQTTSRSLPTARSSPATGDWHRPLAARSGAFRAAPTARAGAK